MVELKLAIPSDQGEQMSRYATVNLLDVEDSVGERAPGIEGRFGRKHLDLRDLGVSLFRYAANLRGPMAHSRAIGRCPLGSPSMGDDAQPEMAIQRSSRQA